MAGNSGRDDLGKGYSSEGSGGFNSGMEARNYTLPKNIDELRVATNPKVTYGGQVLGAYAGKGGCKPGNSATHGKLEKQT